MSLITVRDLSKSFSGPDGRPLQVLDHISLGVSEGEFVALLGRSGSGKSTLLRCIAGLIAPTEGEVLFRGKPLTGTNRETTMVFQTFALLPWLTVQANVELGLEARGVDPAERAERALRAIDQVGLDGYESAYPKELSGGMRQRVGFARALVVEPAALLMDEPFSALDVLTSENLRGELLEIWEGQRFPTKTMIMVTHNIEEAVLLADRILILGTNPGRIREELVNPLPRPRHRRSAEFEALVDQIYRMMTQRDATPAPTRLSTADASGGTLSDSPLPQATVDGLSGLAEILLARHNGAADLADLADNLGLAVDDLLPLVDALVLLGFADLDGDRLALSARGQVFAGANIQDSKEIFARASLERAPLVRTIFRALRGSRDGTLPAGFFTDILRNSIGEERAVAQLDVAVNWGRYAELYAYDADSGQIIREDNGIGATLTGLPGSARRGALHLYLGAAPGSGKTFTMLRDGRALRDHGEDVVIGFVDTGGRPRTEDAIGGLETIPAGGDGDMDLAAVLARGPSVVLVDDFGRHQAAIAALRDAGIDVISTVDVSDLDRAAATVRQFTGTAPATTVPDTALAEADDIRFVDSSPEALQKRLKHGNIYPADRVGKALGGLFATASLAALREIGLRVVAETLTAPGSGGEPGPRPEQPHVLVVIAAPDGADALVQRGVRLARPSGATCTVLAIAAAGAARHPGWTSSLRTTVSQAGAEFMTRDGKDGAATICQAVRETGARHLVLAATHARLADRWRPSLAERLAEQLPDVHLHIVVGQEEQMAGTDGAAADAAAAVRRGEVRVYLGYAPGCGVTTAMLEEAARRRSRGADVVVATVDTRGREAVHALLDGLELVGDGTTLQVEAVLDRRPEVVCVDDLAATDANGQTRFDGARRLADAGITVVTTVYVGSLSEDGSVSADGGGGLDEDAVLAFADEIELVDVPPAVLLERIRQGDLVPETEMTTALRTEYDPDRLAAQRERAFRLVTEHADRRLAAYQRGGVPLPKQARPVIVACVPPRPGVEPLIRLSAALAARLTGEFKAVTVLPAAPGRDEERKQLVAGYATLAEQLGGKFEVRHGAPVGTLLAFAREHHATELLLSRRAARRGGRHPVLRGLTRLADGAEVHVLPVHYRHGGTEP
jgi:NitT/TauT family transport system ATP-binding protein